MRTNNFWHKVFLRIVLSLIIPFCHGGMMSITSNERYNNAVIEHSFVVAYFYRSQLPDKEFATSESRKAYRDEQKRYRRERKEIIDTHRKVIKVMSEMPRYEHTKITFLLIDLSRVPRLAQQHNVTQADTFMLIRKGETIKTMTPQKNVTLQQLQDFVESAWNEILDKKLETYEKEREWQLQQNAANAAAVGPYMWGGYPFTPYCFDGPFCGPYASFGVGFYV